MADRQFAPRSDVNSITLVGRIGSVRYNESKTPALNVNLANNRLAGSTQNDDLREVTSWIPVVLFGNQAKGLYDKIGEDGLKGTQVAVTGRLQAGRSQQVKTVGNGEREFTQTDLEVVCDSRGGFQLLGSGNRSAQASSGQGTSEAPATEIPAEF